MSIQNLKDQMPEYAKDTKLNLGRLVSGADVEGLTKIQAAAIALASAYATKNHKIVEAVSNEFKDTLSEQDVNAARAAATIMGMNNVYYRFVHLCSDKDYGTMPANLRMNIIANPGVEKVDFELYSLAVSAINGCGMCIDAHVNEVTKAGVTKLGVQSTIRIASVINAAAQVAEIEDLSNFKAQL